MFVSLLYHRIAALLTGLVIWHWNSVRTPNLNKVEPVQYLDGLSLGFCNLGCSGGTMANGSELLIWESNSNSCFVRFIHLRTNTLEKRINPTLLPPAMGQLIRRLKNNALKRSHQFGPKDERRRAQHPIDHYYFHRKKKYLI